MRSVWDEADPDGRVGAADLHDPSRFLGRPQPRDENHREDEVEEKAGSLRGSSSKVPFGRSGCVACAFFLVLRVRACVLPRCCGHTSGGAARARRGRNARRARRGPRRTARRGISTDAARGPGRAARDAGRAGHQGRGRHCAVLGCHGLAPRRVGPVPQGSEPSPRRRTYTASRNQRLHGKSCFGVSLVSLASSWQGAQGPNP